MDPGRRRGRASHHGAAATETAPALANLLSYAVFPAVIWEQEGVTPTVLAGLAALGLVIARRLTAGLREDLATGAPAARVIANRALFDRSELQERGLVAIT